MLTSTKANIQLEVSVSRIRNQLCPASEAVLSTIKLPGQSYLTSTRKRKHRLSQQFMCLYIMPHAASRKLKLPCLGLGKHVYIQWNLIHLEHNMDFSFSLISFFLRTIEQRLSNFFELDPPNTMNMSHPHTHKHTCVTHVCNKVSQNNTHTWEAHWHLRL